MINYSRFTECWCWAQIVGFGYTLGIVFQHIVCIVGVGLLPSAYKLQFVLPIIECTSHQKLKFEVSSKSSQFVLGIAVLAALKPQFVRRFWC